MRRVVRLLPRIGGCHAAERGPLPTHLALLMLVSCQGACGGPGTLAGPPARDDVEFSMSASVAPGAPIADVDDVPPNDGFFADLPPEVAFIDLGVLGVRAGHTGDIEVETHGLGAMQVIVFGHPEAHVILEHVVDPDGAVVVSADDRDDLSAQELAFARGFSGPVFSINRTLPAVQSGAFLVPNTPAVFPLDGTWQMRVGQYDVDVTEQPPRRRPIDRPVRVVLVGRGRDNGNGYVALNVHRLGTSAAGEMDLLVSSAIEIARSAWGAVALELSPIRETRAPDISGVVTLAGDVCDVSALDALAARIATGPPGINLLLVDRFSCVVSGGIDVGGSFGGVSGGIPGPAWLRGSRRGGVAVAVERAADNPEVLGAVIAHELSHFLGLFHTKESGGGTDAIHDEIDDSPAGDDADENLMYFSAGTELRLSPGQGQVLRTSPWVTAESIGE